MRKSGKSSSNLQGMVSEPQDNKKQSTPPDYGEWLNIIGSNNSTSDYSVGEDCEVSKSHQESPNSSRPRTSPRAPSSNTQTFIYHHK